MANPSRRAFLGAVPAAALMAWRAEPFLAAQGGGPRDPIADLITRESGRLLKDIKARGLRAEHLRAFDLNLRLATAHGQQRGLDAALRRAARGADRAAVLDGLEAATGFDHEVHELERAFPDLRGLDLDVRRSGRRSRAGYDGALRAVQAGRGFTEAQRQLGLLADGVRARLEPYLAGIDGLRAGGARIVRVQHGSCEVYRMALEMAELLAEVICALAIVDPALVPICFVLFMEVQIAKFLMIIACGG